MCAMQKARGRGSHKVILMGEHAVVHGHPALGAALSASVRVTVEPGGDGIDVQGSAVGSDVLPALRAMTREAGLADTGMIVHVQGDLPPGAGLGGSAALCVAFARATLEASGRKAGMGAVLELASVGEAVFHGRPSGLDAWLAASGTPALYVRGEDPRTVAVGSDLHMAVLVDPARTPTSVMVEGVRLRLEARPEQTRLLFERIEKLVHQGVLALAEGDGVLLGEAMDMNHALLAELGVSTRELDRLCERARTAGALGAKMTGGGGGGAVIALAEDESAAREIARVAEGLTEAAFATLIPRTARR